MDFGTILSRVESLTLVTTQDDLIKDSIRMGLDRAT